MKKSLITKYISSERFKSYKGIEEYIENLIFSKKAYIPKSINNLLTEKLMCDSTDGGSLDV